MWISTELVIIYTNGQESPKFLIVYRRRALFSSLAFVLEFKGKK
jgi:hypothetical protein